MTRPAVVFGDVHGQADQLAQLIKIIRERFGQEVDIYSVGDLVDRGPDSKGVIEICVKEGIHGQLGNHEQWIQTLASKSIFQPYCLQKIMGGAYTIQSYGIDPDGGRNSYLLGKNLYEAMPESHRDWLTNLPCYRRIEVGGDVYWLIHAGLAASAVFGWRLTKDYVGVDLDDEFILKSMAEEAQTRDSLLWPSPQVGEHDNLYHFNNACQIFGHKIVNEPIIKDHYIALDTGCGTRHPYTLTAIILPTKEIIQVGPIDNWTE